MTDHPKELMDLDDLLRQACADDLPDDAAAAMRRRINMFLAETRGKRETSSRAWLLPRVAWAALSILMLIAGFLLQGAKASTPLAERIASVKTAYANLPTTRR